MGNKKIVGTALSCLMLLNSAFNVTYAANTEIKNVNHSSQETKNKILKYGALVAGCLTAIGGLICADYNYFSDIKYPLIFDFNSKSGARGFDAEQMISKYQKLGKEFFVITQIEESEYVIQYFSSNGNIFSEMKISKSELNCLLSGSCKIPRNSGVYPGTEMIFKTMRNKILPPDEKNCDLTLHKDDFTLTAYPLIFDFNSKSGARSSDAEQMISKYQKSGKEFVVITRFAENEYVIECFDCNGLPSNMVKVSASRLDFLLGGSYKVDKLKKEGTIVCSGTKFVFKSMCNEKNCNLTSHKNDFTLTAYNLIFDPESKSVYFCARIPQIKQMISKHQKSGKEFVVITRFAENEYVIECFDSSGNICSIMGVNKHELDFILHGVYKVDELKKKGTGVYSGDIIMFKMTCIKVLPPYEEPYALTLREHGCTLTAVLYDNEKTLEKFKEDTLENEFIYSPSKSRDVVGFDKEFSNELKEYEMNTCYNINTDRKLVTKMVFIDVGKLKSMSESERGKVLRLLDFCSSKIVLCNCKDPKLNEIFDTEKDCKKVDYSGNESDVKEQLKDAFENIYLSAKTGKYEAFAREYIRIKCGVNVLQIKSI